MTRREFLRAVFRSWPVRVVGLSLAGVVVAYVAIWLWQARNVVTFIAVVVGLVILGHALTYAFSSERRRAGLDEESRLTRSHWSYGFRGLLWSGFGVAVGNLIAYWSGGRDPTGGLVVGLAIAGFGAIAHAVWAARRAG
jgi:uncharacterized membrane protein